MEEERVSNEAAYKGMRELTCDDSRVAQYHLRETRRTWKVLEWVTTRSQLRGSRSKEIKSEARRRHVPGLQSPRRFRAPRARSRGAWGERSTSRPALAHESSVCSQHFPTPDRRPFQLRHPFQTPRAPSTSLPLPCPTPAALPTHTRPSSQSPSTRSRSPCSLLLRLCGQARPVR